MRNEFLRPQQETAVHIGEFILFYRTLPLRLKIEKQYFHNEKSFTLKCESTFGHYTHLTRAKSARVFIMSTDDSTNQKLVNSESAATATGNFVQKICVENFIRHHRRDESPLKMKIYCFAFFRIVFVTITHRTHE